MTLLIHMERTDSNAESYNEDTGILMKTVNIEKGNTRIMWIKALPFALHGNALLNQKSVFFSHSNQTNHFWRIFPPKSLCSTKASRIIWNITYLKLHTTMIFVLYFFFYFLEVIYSICLGILVKISSLKSKIERLQEQKVGISNLQVFSYKALFRWKLKLTLYSNPSRLFHIKWYIIMLCAEISEIKKYELCANSTENTNWYD